MLECSDTLGERRGRGIDAAQVRDFIDLSLENARVDSLSNGDPNSATHSPELQSQRQRQRVVKSHLPEESKCSSGCSHVFQGHGGLQAD